MDDKIFYNKLVRDAIPEIIRAKGSLCEVRELAPEEYERELLKKIEEEASAFQKIESKEELVRELADLLDVIEEVKKLKNVSEEEIQQAKVVALAKKGGFLKRLFLVWSSNDGYKTNEKKNT